MTRDDALREAVRELLDAWRDEQFSQHSEECRDAYCSHGAPCECGFSRVTHAIRRLRDLTEERER